MILLRFVAIVLFAAFAGSTLAGVGEVKMESKADGEPLLMTFAYKDLDLARMTLVSTDREGRGSMIMREGKVYSVVESDGQTVVIDMASLSKLASSVANQNQSTELFYSRLISLENTGKEETIVAIKGDVYTMVWDDNGTQRTSEIVLTRDSAVVEYTRAWMNFGDRMADIFEIERVSENDLRKAIVDKKVGVLRLDDQFVLKEINTGNVSSSTFELPATPMDVSGLESLGKMFDSAPSDTDAAEDEGEEKVGLWGAINKKLNRQTERQKDRSEDVVDDATDEAADRAISDSVDKAVDKVFDIFK